MRTNRRYVQIDPDVLERVRQIDLLSYLREFEPSNLVKVKGTSNVYCTAEHDSLKISNGKWYWWSRGFGGYSALDYLIKVKEYDFVEAVEILTGQTMADWKPPAPKKNEPKVLLLPLKNKDCNRVIQYLFGRGIDYQLIQECIADGTLYESANYHNVVFIGKDESGTPKYAALRSTLGSTFKQDAWEFAHKYCGKVWYVCGMVMLPITVIFMILVIGKNEDCVGSKLWLCILLLGGVSDLPFCRDDHNIFHYLTSLSIRLYRYSACLTGFS